MDSSLRCVSSIARPSETPARKALSKPPGLHPSTTGRRTVRPVRLGPGPVDQLGAYMDVNGEHRYGFPFPFHIQQPVFVQRPSDHLNNTAEWNCRAETLTFLVHDRQSRRIQAVSLSNYRICGRPNVAHH